VPAHSRTKLTRRLVALDRTLADSRPTSEAISRRLRLSRSDLRRAVPLVDSYVTNDIPQQRHCRSAGRRRHLLKAARRSGDARNGRRGPGEGRRLAPLPRSPEVTEVVATSRARRGSGVHHHQAAGGRLDAAAFSDKIGPKAGGFGSPGTPGIEARTSGSGRHLAAAGDHDCLPAERQLAVSTVLSLPSIY